MPEALKPVTKMLEDAGVPIVCGPNPIPAPETLSDQAKLAWSQLPQVPSPVRDPKKFAAVREFTSLLELVDYERKCLIRQTTALSLLSNEGLQAH